MLRTHTCGELRAEDVGRETTLAGWVETTRDHGQVMFVVLRDRYGITQLVFRAEDEALYAEGRALRGEWVIRVTGTVQSRGEKDRNPNMPTGDIEIAVSSVEILNEAEPLPIGVTDEDLSSDELRFRYRYLDLRRPAMQEAMLLRHRVMQRMRRTCTDLGFVEIETPLLTKSTPEGARDYLVPSRISGGSFYALPQSPQLFKQMLMVSGFDRYFQIARCFRDEDLRADRQPEFTQLDLEMSFVEESDVMAASETILRDVVRDAIGVELPDPIPHMSYAEAMLKYGSDKPDLRFGLEIQDVSNCVRGCGFGVFAKVVEGGGVVRGLRVEGAAGYSRKQIDGLQNVVAEYGARGLAWLKVQDEIRSSFAKFLEDDERERLLAEMGAKPEDLLLFVAGDASMVAASLGALRLELGRQLDLIPDDVYKPLWVVDFPLFEWNEDEERWDASHHPFTSPNLEDVEKLATEPGSVRARAYDLVLHGAEIAGGSVRIHRHEVQQAVFAALGITPELAEQKFGFLLNAFRYGAPPHGGIAFGLDRLVAILAGESSIREVIPFPKTTSAACLLTGAPAVVDGGQLGELALRVESPEKPASDEISK